MKVLGSMLMIFLMLTAGCIEKGASTPTSRREIPEKGVVFKNEDFVVVKFEEEICVIPLENREFVVLILSGGESGTFERLESSGEELCFSLAEMGYPNSIRIEYEDCKLDPIELEWRCNRISEEVPLRR